MEIWLSIDPHVSPPPSLPLKVSLCPVSACLTVTGCDNERTKYAQDNKGQRLTAAATETHRAETGAGVAIELILGPQGAEAG